MNKDIARQAYHFKTGLTISYDQISTYQFEKEYVRDNNRPLERTGYVILHINLRLKGNNNLIKIGVGDYKASEDANNTIEILTLAFTCTC